MTITGSPSTSKRIHSGVRRRRAILSCHSCRTRRLKCDKVRPVCSRCTQNGDQCVWAVDGLSRFPSNVQPHRPPQSDIEAESIHPMDDATVDSDSNLSVPEEFSASIPGQESHSKNPWTGYLTSQHGGRSRYIPSSFWANTDHDSFELDDVLSSVPLFPFPVCCCNQSAVSRFSIPTAESPTLGNRSPLSSDAKSFQTHKNCCNRMNSLSGLLDGLPPKETCDILYQNFLRCIHPLIILLHKPTFHSQYIRFWDWWESWDREEIPDGILAEIPSFLPLLFAVLFAGYFGAHDTSQDLDLAVNATVLYNAHSHALSLVCFPQSPTIYSLIAFLIVQNLLVREEEALSACSFIGIALRAAQAMGLHRDGAHFQLDPVQAEIRRRVWWHIIHTDVMTCISSGLPPVMVIDNLYDTNMISEVKDEYLNNPEELVAQPFEPSLRAFENQHQFESKLENSSDIQIVDIHHVVAIGRYKITTLMRQILRRQFDVEPMGSKDITALKKAVDQQNLETTARIHRIANMHLPTTVCPPKRPKSTGSANTNYDNAFQNWSQILLRLMNHKAYCMFYQPLLRGKYGSVSSRARKDAMRHCHAYIECFLEICTTQSFRPFYWMYPGMYQPLQATAIILADLIKNPNTDEALHLRTLVDRLFSLIGPDGFGSSLGKTSKRNLTTAGRDVWEMLRRLRRQAWNKAGLDPEFVWMNPQFKARNSPSEYLAQGNASEVLGQPQDVVPAIAIPNLEPSDTFLQPEIELFSDATWMGNADLSTGRVDQTGQFSLGDVEGFDWQHWDFLLQQSFNMPDPGQPNF